MHRKVSKCVNPWPFPANVLRNRHARTGGRPGRKADLFDVTPTSSSGPVEFNSLRSDPFAASTPSTLSPTPRSRSQPHIPPSPIRPTFTNLVPNEILKDHARRVALNTQYSDSDEDPPGPIRPPARISRPTDSVRTLKGVKVFDQYLRRSSQK